MRSLAPALAICVLLLGSCKQEEALLSDHFNKPLRNKTMALLSSPFSVEKGKANERQEIPGGFLRPAPKSKKRGRKPSISDPFSRGYEPKERTEDDLVVKTFPKVRKRQNFVGERFRLFSRDPNKKKRKKQRKLKNRDPFGRKDKEMDQRQSPRGQKDLFQNGVLPKMKDDR